MDPQEKHHLVTRDVLEMVMAVGIAGILAAMLAIHRDGSMYWLIPGAASGILAGVSGSLARAAHLDLEEVRRLNRNRRND